MNVKKNILRSLIVGTLSTVALSACMSDSSTESVKEGTGETTPVVAVKSNGEKIVGNLKSTILAASTATDEGVGEALAQFDKDTGQFSDIDYDLFRAEEIKYVTEYEKEINEGKQGEFLSADKNSSNKASGGRAKHLEKIALFATAYNTPDSQFYHDDELKMTLETALDYWLKEDPHSINWWWRMIGFPKRMATTAVLMSDFLSKELNTRIGEYLAWGFEHGGKDFSGANAVDVAIITVKGAALTEDKEILKETAEVMTREFSMMTKFPYPKNGDERNAMGGLQVDSSFTQHSAHGYQLYLAHYGIDYFNAIITFFTATNGTDFAFSADKVKLLEDSFLISVPWIIFEGSFDENNTGRFIGEESVSRYVDHYKKVIALNTPRKAELEKMLAWVENGNTEDNYLSGNKSFWRHDYMIQRREGYYSSVRMTSKRTTGNSAGNGQAENNIHTSDNVNYIMTHGKEYDGLFYDNENWDWNKIPGTTVEQTIGDQTVIPYWGEHGTGGNAFAGVVSDEENGAAGVIFDNHGITAKKAWFFFDNFFVALGQNIKSPETSEDIITTLNQVNLNGEVVRVNTSNQTSIHHDSVGYLIAGNSDNVEDAVDNDIFHVGINHGQQPEDAQYQYLVYPNITAADFKVKADEYTAQYPVDIQTSDNYQSVFKSDFSTGYIVSYAASDITLSNGVTIQTNGPITLMIKDLGNEKMEILASNPVGESNPLAEIVPTAYDTAITIDGTNYHVAFGQGLYEGQTQIVKASK